MINSLEDIKAAILKADALSLSETEFEKFISNSVSKVEMRLTNLVGEYVVADAKNETPSYVFRANAVKHAEIEFIQIEVLMKLWELKSAGAERDVQFPDGSRIVLQAFGSDDYERFINAHIMSAERYLMDFMG